MVASVANPPTWWSRRSVLRRRTSFWICACAASAAASGFFSGVRRLKSSSTGFVFGGCDSGCGAGCGGEDCAATAASRSESRLGWKVTASSRAREVISVPLRALGDPLLDDRERFRANGPGGIGGHPRPVRRIGGGCQLELPHQEAALWRFVARRHEDEVESPRARWQVGSHRGPVDEVAIAVGRQIETARAGGAV